MSEGRHGYTIMPLSDDHNFFLGYFDCGHDPRLNKWLTDFAKRYHDSGLCRVWLHVPVDDPTNIIGYFTLSATTAMKRDIPVKGLGVPGQMREIPAVLLGKFAVDKNFQGGRASAEMMRHVFASHLEVAGLIGAVVLILHTRHPKLQEFYKKFGFKSARRVSEGPVAQQHDLMWIKTTTIREYLGRG